MARTVKDAALDTRTSRLKLKRRREPHWKGISQGAHIGYRKGKNGGSWIARQYGEGGKYRYHKIGSADDIQDADGAKIFSFDQARNRSLGDTQADLVKRHHAAKALGRGLNLYHREMRGPPRRRRSGITHDCTIQFALALNASVSFAIHRRMAAGPCPSMSAMRRSCNQTVSKPPRYRVLFKLAGALTCTECRLRVSTRRAEDPAPMSPVGRQAGGLGVVAGVGNCSCARYCARSG